MRQLIAALLFAGCITFQVWAQGSSGQGATEQPVPEQPIPEQPIPEQPGAAAKKSPDQNPTQGNDTVVPGGAARDLTRQPAASDFPLDKFQEFSAVMVGGIVPTDAPPAHIYRSGNLFRTEGVDGHSFWVVNMAKHTEHMVASKNCMTGHYLNSRTFPFYLTGPDYKYERVSVGDENVDGHLSHVEDITISGPDKPTPFHIRVWEAQDLQGFPIRIENRPPGGAHRTWEYKNVMLGSADPTLFIVPANGCQNADDFKVIQKVPAPAPKKAPAAPQQ